MLKKNRVDLAQLVLDAGADVNQAAVNGITPLMAAAFAGQTAMVEAIAGQGRRRRRALDRLQKNAMTYAAGEGHTDIVLLLLAHGVDPNAVYSNDLTALMWAAGFGKTDTVRALLAAGANPSLKDNRGKTAADMARERAVRRAATAGRRREVGGADVAPSAPQRVRGPSARPAVRRGRRTSACSAPATCSATAAASTQLVVKCTALIKSLSAGSFRPHAGSVTPKNLTG